MVCIPRVHCYYFCLEPMARKDTWIRTTSVTVMAIFFSKVAFWKLLDHNYVQVFFSRITWNIENSILKDTLQLNNLRTWINIRAEPFIKSSVNIMKQKQMKVPGKRSVAQKSKRALRKKLHLNRPCFTPFILFFFS